MNHQISADHLSLQKIREIIETNTKLELSDSAKQKIQKCRDYLDKKMSTAGEVHYGINTGFGSLCNTVISNEDLGKLQRNLVLSHACGTGEEVPKKIVRLMLLLKVQGLSYGNSGCQLETVQRLIDFYNNDITPVVYQLGSLGASGDLAPLAHLSLPLIGEGEVYFGGDRMKSSEMLSLMNWKKLELKSKEGLALLNGTQFMSAYGVHCLLHTQQLSIAADTVAALSLEAYDGRLNPFYQNVNEIRNQVGQIETAKVFREILEGSEIITRQKEHVQDPYSFRCIPQVHGASKDAIKYACEIFEQEINAVTDNPTIFPDSDEIISAGNFHGQPLAITFDFLVIAVAELGSISERRIYQLISGTRGLPPFLIATPGLNSGFMIPQYTAASIVSQNKQLCAPASVDSIVSSNGQEDHVSMGANAATKTLRVVENVQRIIGIELLNAAQAIEFRRPAKTSPLLEKILTDFRKQVSFISEDKYMHPEIEKSINFIKKIGN